MFAEATGHAAPSRRLRAGGKAGEGERFTHCVDLMIAPGPESLAHARTFAPARSTGRCSKSGAPMLILPPDWKPGPVGDNIVIAWKPGARPCARSMTRCRCSNGRKR